MFQWIRPPWRSFKPTPENEEGPWPWVGSPFLAAVSVHDYHDKEGEYHWEFEMLVFTETGIQMANCGEEWGWSESDIEWIAKVPEPNQT